MSSIEPVRRVEVSALFWKDMAAWRRHPDSLAIRSGIADVVLRAARGEPAGDMPFMGRRSLWDGIGHAHVGSKLTLFTVRPNPESMRLCALKKHDFYGFRSERRSRAEDAALKIRNAASGPSVPSPEWSDLRWKDPSEIPSHPELRELSIQGLKRLYAEVLEESETFEKLARHVRGVSPRMQSAMEEVWLSGLVEAQSAVEGEILRASRPPRPHVHPDEFLTWASSP